MSAADGPSAVAVKLPDKSSGATITVGLAAVFFVVSMYFVYRSFYGMRIESGKH